MANVGIVRYYDNVKGFGIIKAHETNQEFPIYLYNLINPIKENDFVHFEVENIQGKLNAVRVKVF